MKKYDTESQARIADFTNEALPTIRRARATISGLQYICRACRRIFLAKRAAAIKRGYRCDACYHDFVTAKFLV